MNSSKLREPLPKDDLKPYWDAEDTDDDDWSYNGDPNSYRHHSKMVYAILFSMAGMLIVFFAISFFG